MDIHGYDAWKLRAPGVGHDDPIEEPSEWTEEDELAAREAEDYEAHIAEQEAAFERSQHCPVCDGYMPEECDGDHRDDPTDYSLR